MKLMNKASESTIPRKRPSNDHYNDCGLEGFRNPKRFVQAVRDFPPGCGIQEPDRKPLKMIVENNQLNNFKPNEVGRIKTEPGSGTACKVQFLDPICSKNAAAQMPKVETTVITEMKALNRLDNVDKDVGNKVKSLESKEYGERKRIEPAEFKKNKTSFVPKPPPKVKFWDPRHEDQPGVTTTFVSRGKPLNNLDNVDTNIRKLTTIVDPREHMKREKIKEAMKVFNEVYTQLIRDNSLKPESEKSAMCNLPLEAVKLVKRKLKWMEPEKRLGPICGVQVGDKFRFRSQLKMIGLHCQEQSGIDYTNNEGKKLAISIVDSHRYSKTSVSRDTLIYSGHGGRQLFGPRILPPEDQKLERGNLALKNSIHARNPVRVIRKIKDDVYLYDGLYLVNRCKQERSEEGKLVFMFHLNRVPGQPHVVPSW